MTEAWADTEIEFAKHRHEWLMLKNIPARDFDLDNDRWWAVIYAYNEGDSFGGALPADGRPRFEMGWTKEQIEAREAELAALDPKG